MAVHVSMLLAGLLVLQSPAETTQPNLPAEQLTKFDYHEAELRWQNGAWQLWAGPVWLKDFGKREAEAREAQRLIRDLQLTERGTIGSPHPIMEYWLCNGAAPQSHPQGLQTLAFHPKELRVSQTRDQWSLRDDRRTLFVFGTHEQDAQLALHVIRRYGFNQVGYVGKPMPLLIIFLASRNEHVASPIETLQTLEDKKSSLSQQDRNTRRAAADQRRNDQKRENLGKNELADLQSASRQLTPAGISAGPRSPGDRVPINWQQVHVRQDDQEWKLVFGNHTLARFGANEREARQAQETIRHYHFTEQCFVEGAEPPLSYFLVNGKAPRGVRFGLVTIPFKPELAGARKQGDDWVVAQGDQVLWNFRDRESAARELLKTIRTFGFDHLCILGVPEQGGLVFFVRTYLTSRSFDG